METANPYTNPAEQDAWAQGYAFYQPTLRNGGGNFSALYLKLDVTVRPAACDGWTCAIVDANRAQQALELKLTTEGLADEFANGATRDILKPDNGLSVTEALERKQPRSASR